MRNLSKLRDPEDTNPYKKLSVSHDMSQAEREKYRMKVTEAKQLNKQEQSGKVKFVVRGPPWERKVVKVQVKR